MSQSNETLARRAVASKHWRWMPGMLDDYGSRVVFVGVGDKVVLTTYDRVGDENDYDEMQSVPDLDDPATLGCLLALVRKAYGRRFVRIAWAESRAVVTIAGTRRFEGSTLAAALVAALEAAP